jgi:hypothetical protein
VPRDPLFTALFYTGFQLGLYADWPIVLFQQQGKRLVGQFLKSGQFSAVQSSLPPFHGNALLVWNHWNYSANETAMNVIAIAILDTLWATRFSTLRGRS